MAVRLAFRHRRGARLESAARDAHGTLTDRVTFTTGAAVVVLSVLLWLPALEAFPLPYAAPPETTTQLETSDAAPELPCGRLHCFRIRSGLNATLPAGSDRADASSTSECSDTRYLMCLPDSQSNCPAYVCLMQGDSCAPTRCQSLSI